MKLSIVGVMVMLGTLFWLAPAGAHGPDEADFKVRFGTNGLERSVTVDWDLAGTLEYSTVLGQWKKTTNSTTLLRTGRRHLTFEYPSAKLPRQMYFRLRLPDDNTDEHRHLGVVETYDPFIAGQTVQPVNPSWQISRPQPVHHIRLHLVRCADTSGANRVALQTNEFQQYVDEANTIFFRSGIRFDWDPVADVENVNNSALNSDVSLLVLASSLNNQSSPPQEGVHYSRTNNSAVRSAFALARKGKLVVYATQFGSTSDTKFYWDGTNRWRLKALGGGYSSWAGNAVVLSGSLQGLHLLAHEIGHYLNNMHTFAVVNPDGDGYPGELADMQNYIRGQLFNGDTAPADIVNLFDADGYWVRDTPADPGTRLFDELNGGNECTNNLNGTVNVTVLSGGENTGSHSFSFAPDRLNLQSYFRCESLGVMRQSADQIARTRDVLENRHRHHLIARHIAGAHGSSLERTDLYNSGTESHADMQLLRTRHDQLILLRRRTVDDAFQLLAFNVDTQGLVSLRSLTTGLPCKSAKAVSMGLGLVAVGYVTTNERPGVLLYRVSENSVWNVESSWTSPQGNVREIEVERFGRVNLAVAVRTADASDNTGIHCLLVDADGAMRLQSYNELGTSTGIALAPAGARPLAVARRDAGGDLLLETWKLTEEREIGATLERIDSASAGAINRAALLAMDVDHLVTPVATGSGDLKLISWSLDAGGYITRMGNGTTVTNLAVWETARFSTDLIAVAARSDSGGPIVRLYQTDTAGNFTLRQSDTTQIVAISARAWPTCALIRDQHLAVARVMPDGQPEVRIYRAPF